jgi:hypothetical protein
MKDPVAERERQSLEKDKAYSRAYYAANQEKCRATRRAWKLNNQEKVQAGHSAWSRTNRDRVAASRRSRRASDSRFRATENLRRRVREVLKEAPKSQKTLKLFGCSPSFLRGHLTGLFKPGMTWENYGQWHIDHIKPCAAFDLRDPEQQKQCFHFSNLQPLWADENQRKGANFIKSVNFVVG